MKTVASILAVKGAEVFAVAPGASVYDALQVLAEKNVGALAVVDGGKLVGILSERDYARKVVLVDRSSRGTLVSEIMTAKVETIAATSSIEECMELMTERHVRHLPVLDGEELVGVISIGDVVKAVIADLAAMVEQLDAYIRGR
ncbi:MAG: histidine kinase [Actinobacteria bacterium RBG_16_68_21]|nr:MAG: histidine kinase [Actinobacteria bacterium RBG_16_68_21]